MFPKLLSACLGLLLVGADAGEMRRIHELSRQGGWSFLCYDALTNHVSFIRNGRTEPIFPLADEFPFRTGHHAYPSLSPDGRRIAFVRPADRHTFEEIVTVFDLDRNQRTDVLRWPSRVWGLAWSPDGEEIAMVADQNARTGLYLLRLADGSVAPWLENPEVSTDSAPSWSPDGQALAIQRDVKLDAEIVVVDRATRTPRRVAVGRYPAWSPHGDVIAFLDLDGRHSLIVRPDGTEPREIFSPIQFTQQLIQQVVWSPNRNQLIFHRTHGMKGDARVIFLYDLAADRGRRIYTGESLQIVDWRATP